MSISDRERLIVALDVPSVGEALQIVETLGETVSFYKVGMQLQFAGGLPFVEELIQNHDKKVFLDSKLLDIDQTITSAVRNISRMGVSFLTVHGNGKTIKAAIQGRGDSDLKILAVTYLTNLDAHDLADLGFYDAINNPNSVADYVLARAKKSQESGADGVIASGEEADAIREMAGENLKIITPGIRPDGSDVNDQKRIVTPTKAINAGADYLVVGRPITQASDMKVAAEAIQKEIREALNRSEFVQAAE